MRGLKGKRVLVTGGLGDLGYAAIVRLVEEGCLVASFEIKPNEKGNLGKLGLFHQVLDISKESEVVQACRQIHERVGPIEVVVNSAARFLFKSVDTTLEDWASISSVNIVRTEQVIHRIRPHVKQAGSGSVINFSFVSGFVGQTNFSTYNATRFAIWGLNKCWAQDFAPNKIRLNALFPGHVYTSACNHSREKLGLDIESENRLASALYLLNCQGKPEEMAGEVAFPASKESSFMIGVDLVVDSDYLAH